ncbi:MAG: dephospho-CoA kinase [Saprospiraceae bacterium]
MEESSTSGDKTALRVGITGGIGSGKSTVCAIFKTLGIPVYSADDWAKWLIQHDSALREGIIALLGPEAYNPDGTYNRPWVGQIVFANPEKLASLNALVHPAVERHSRDWHLRQIEQGAPYTLREAALLIESGAYRFLDALIVVTAPENIRIQRVMSRDKVTGEAVQARIRQQMPESEKCGYADYLIDNDGKKALIPQVLAIHHALLQRKGGHAPKK